jgi:hypothetical protein
MPAPDEVHSALARRPRARFGAYDPRWDTWLLPRVTGHHTGTTDENIQWAACKWGLADNLLRAIAFRESSWFQYETYPDGRCVLQHGCGDMIESPTTASSEYCSGLSRRGHDYTTDFGAGVCPRTFSIVGVMSWQDPSSVAAKKGGCAGSVLAELTTGRDTPGAVSACGTRAPGGQWTRTATSRS